MKRLFFLPVLFFSILIHAQDFKVFHEKKDHSFIIYATNNERYPVSMSIDLDVSNLIFSEGDKKIFVIPPKTEKLKIGELNPGEGRGGTKLSYKFKFTMGDVTIVDYDKSFEYDLPFAKGKSYNLAQGYNGSSSHQNENALDFTMPEGSEILAAREGVIVEVVQNNTESCPAKECEKYNNKVIVMHTDGTYACYTHIKYNGSRVKAGDTVKKGDVIAYSGNVGWTTGPHLHFVCFIGGFGKRNSLETRFRIDNGDKSVLLTEGNTYKRDY